MKNGFTIQGRLLDGAVAFLEVAERRSFRAAATELGVSPSALSQTIKALETSLGTSLLSRTTRSVGLTEAGSVFLEQLRPSLDGLEKAFETVQAFVGHPSGLLRLNMPRGVIPFLLDPILDEFAKAHPDVQVEIFADDGFTDIVAEGFDAGVRLGEYLATDMTAVRLSPPFQFCVAGAPSYFDKHGTPARPEDLRLHQCIRFRGAKTGVYRWEFQEGSRKFEIAVDGPLIVNDTSVQLSAALRGTGLIYSAEPIVAPYLERGALKTVLDRFRSTSPGLFLYYPSRAQALPKLRAFIDCMAGVSKRLKPSLEPR